MFHLVSSHSSGGKSQLVALVLFLELVPARAHARAESCTMC